MINTEDAFSLPGRNSDIGIQKGCINVNNKVDTIICYDLFMFMTNFAILTDRREYKKKVL